MELIRRLKASAEKAKMAAFERRLSRLLEDKNSAAFRAVQRYALVEAQKMVGNWLTNHRIAHCWKCKENGQLRKVNDGIYMCAKCFVQSQIQHTGEKVGKLVTAGRS